MISRRSFLKGAAVAAAAPVLAGLPFEPKVEASAHELRYALAFPRASIQGDFAFAFVRGKKVKDYIKINPRFKRIYLTARMSFDDFYWYIQDKFDIDVRFFDLDHPMVRITPSVFEFRNGWDFGDDRSCILLTGGSWNNWTNISTIGYIDGNHFGVYYRVNRGKWKKFYFHNHNTPRVVDEAIRRVDGPVEFVLVDENKAIIVSDYSVSELYPSNVVVPLFGMKELLTIKRFKWNKRMLVADAKKQLNEIWWKDLQK